VAGESSRPQAAQESSCKRADIPFGMQLEQAERTIGVITDFVG